MTVLRLKISLRYVRPPIWRRLEAPSTLTLSQLHEVIQTAMGWTNSHLHAFEVGSVVYSSDLDEHDRQAGHRDEYVTSLVDLSLTVGSQFRYEYDFGDGWEHDVLVEDAQPGDATAVRCLGGERACPPEDCGGPAGYEHLLDALADPTHPDHGDMSEWIGGGLDPAAFDVDAVNASLARLAAGFTRPNRATRRGRR